MGTKPAVDKHSESSHSSLAAGKSGPPGKEETRPSLRGPELWGARYCDELISYIHTKKGQFLRDEEGKLYVVLDGRRISLTLHPENFDLIALILQVCRVTTVERSAHVAVQRLQVKAHKSASSLRLRRFSALSQDRKRLYLPTAAGTLLQITREGVQTVPNGANEDKFWVEHPNGEPLTYSPVDAQAELSHFERLVVDTQACQKAEMRWFVAMHEGLFPYVRDLCPARFVLVHQGSTQQGKTSGAKRFILLHGLGDVQGDASIAALGNMGDTGLLVMDNREQANLTQSLIDFLLFLSTGGARNRSTTDGRLRSGNKNRPAAVITTIEGVWKQELEERCVVVTYKVSGQKIPRAHIEDEIADRRHPMTSALVLVLQRFLQIRTEQKVTPNPRPSFEEHFSALCDLLRAYAVVAGKPEEWAEDIIDVWNRVITDQANDGEESELEYPIRSMYEDSLGSHLVPKVTHQGRTGSLHVTECGALLKRLQELKLPLSLPKTPTGLAHRLRSSNFKSFVVLDEKNAPDIPALKRTARKRPIGLFFPDDDAVTMNDGKTLDASSSANS